MPEGEKRGPPHLSQSDGHAIRLPGRFRVVSVRRAIVRNASFTARALGKISATSGSRRTTFVPSAYRARSDAANGFGKIVFGAQRVFIRRKRSAFLLTLLHIAFAHSELPAEN